MIDPGVVTLAGIVSIVGMVCYGIKVLAGMSVRVDTTLNVRVEDSESENVTDETFFDPLQGQFDDLELTVRRRDFARDHPTLAPLLAAYEGPLVRPEDLGDPRTFLVRAENGVTFAFRLPSKKIQ